MQPINCNNDKILVALSGGADSMALLHMLFANNIDIEAAHFNHNLRGEESDGDEAFVVKYCKENAIKLHCGFARVLEVAKSKKITVEQAARECRYSFLYKIAKNVNAKYIALAHHMDDQAETVLLNLIRGSGMTGLCAMKEYSGMLWRPLLGRKKQELLNYCSEKAVPFRVDSTNVCTDYTRNFIRARTAEFEKINSAFVNNCAKTALILQEEDRYLEKNCALEYENCKTDIGTDCQKMLLLDKAIALRLVRLLAKKAGMVVDFEHKHANLVLNLCTMDTGKSLDLGKGYIARTSYGSLIIQKKQEQNSNIEYCCEFTQGEIETPQGKLIAKIVDKPQKLGQGFPLCIEANIKAMQGAVVRNRQNGDYIYIINAGHKKKLKDVYIDKKIDKEKRNVPVIAIGSEVLWALGVVMSDKIKVTEQTKIMQLQFVAKGD